MRFIKPIAISLSPNTERDDVVLALKILLQPWRWFRGKELKEVEDWFKEYLKPQEAVSFNSGRSALYALLKCFEIGKGDEVLIQAFTCVAVPNSILWAGAKPVFVDIEKETYNIYPADLERKITKKSKAIIVQNTFGIPAKIERIKKISQKNNLFLIEDGAHSLGGRYEDGRKIGSVGEAAFFSFGRDKIISSVFGGIALINQKSKSKNLPRRQAGQKYPKAEQVRFRTGKVKIKNFQKQLDLPSRWWVMQQLLHPIAFTMILPLYNFFGLGKILLVIFQRLKILSVPVVSEEKEGRRPKIFPQKFPNALAILALNQLKKLDKFNQKRRKITKTYQKYLSNSNCLSGAVYLRYPLLMTSANKIYERAKKKGILLGRWYSHVIDPEGVDFKRVGYKRGSCSVAEETANKILNLPTYPRIKEKDVKKVINFLSDRLKS